jgi:HPt (histidine-containing phosphotransfer) domain-containing protein
MVPAAPDARILDVAHLHRQTFGDRALEREVLALFEQQCLRLPPLIAAGKNPNESVDAAHTLKGAARAVGAWRLALLAEALETALGEGRPAETLERLNRALEQAVAAVRGAVAELRSARGPWPPDLSPIRDA